MKTSNRGLLKLSFLPIFVFYSYFGAVYIIFFRDSEIISLTGILFYLLVLVTAVVFIGTIIVLIVSNNYESLIEVRVSKLLKVHSKNSGGRYVLDCYR